MKNSIIKLSIIFMSTCLLSCSNYYHEKANNEYANLQYYKAIKHYNKVILNSDNHDVKIKLANCYRLINDMDKAEPLYAAIVNYPESEPINMFQYAKILMHKGDYINSKIWIKKYLEKVPDDRGAEMLAASCDSLNIFMLDTTLYTLNALNFSELASAFGSVPYKNGMVFSAEKEELNNSRKNPWTGKSYLDLYFSEKNSSGKWSSPQLLEGEINGRYHEGPASFNKSGDVIYFTRSNYSKKKLGKSLKNENNLKLYTAKLVNGRWEQLEEMPFNSNEYSVGHPCISKDEKTLYFISDMPGGYGGTDIYRSTLDSNKWSTPENLGMVVNTTGNEMFPFMSEDGTLYFSSDSHTNMGGLDVFSTSYNEKNKKWLEVENLRYPVNSTKDDFGFVLYADGKTGYLSSNRKTTDMIYEFNKHDPTFNITGVVTEKGTKIPFEDVTVTLIDEGKANKKDTIRTDKNGNYKLKLNPKTDYVVFGSKDYKFTKNTGVSTKNKMISEDFIVNLDLEKVVKEIKKEPKDFVKSFDIAKVVIGKPIVLENVYYDLGKWDIRPYTAVVLDKLVNLLKENPTINIEIGSHTDSRASDNFNLILSNKRSKSVVDYLISKGIDSNRLTWKGYGEKMLVNHCGNNVKCTEEEHQQNRRTEVKVTKITNGSVMK